MSKIKAYLDNGATTKVDERVIESMLPFFREKYGNASSIHSLGTESSKALENARNIIAKAINAKPEEIIFTSGGTESDNLAIMGCVKKDSHIITSKIEHPAVLASFNELQKQGCKVTYLDVNQEGMINLEQLRNSITKDTSLVSIMHANNEIGTIQPIKEIGAICKEKGVFFHTDAVQSFTKIPIDVKDINVDLISMASHKIHGPKGVGALFVKSKIKKTMYGGKQEFNLRPGTENIPGIVGFAKAVELCSKEHVLHMTKLRDKLIKGLLILPNTELNGSKNRLCNNVNISFKYIEGEALGTYLDLEGIASSTGSACSSKNLEPSYVLLAIGLEAVDAHGSLRLTLSRFTTEQEINYVLKVLPKIVEKLRKISPLG